MANAPSWTDEEIGFLLDSPHLTSRQIGEQLGRGPQAAMIMRRKLRNGWSPSQESWTEAEDDTIRSTPHLTAKEVGELLGRSEPAVNYRRKRLKAAGEWSGAEKPWSVGRRKLVAKTCLKCGVLFDGTWYTWAGNGWTSDCSRCKYRGVDRRSGRWDSAAHAAARLQALTVDHAERNGEPWIEADHEVLANPDLTVLEKALRLKRTYHATHQQVSKNGYSNKVGLGDAAKGRWVIANPNVLSAA